MNIFDLNRQLKASKNWWKDNTEQVHVDFLVQSELEGQVRKNGICQSNVKEIMESIRHIDQQVPITVDKNDKIVDGNHRFEAIRQLNLENPGGNFSKVIVYRRDFESDAEKEDYQLTANDPLPAKKLSDKDYADRIVKGLQCGSYYPITWDNYYDDISNYDTLVSLVKSRWKSLGISANKFPGLVKQAVNSAPGSKFRNHVIKELVRQAGCSNITRWNGTQSKQESNGWWLHACGDATYVSPNLIGNSLNTKVNSESVKCTVLFNCSNLEGKTAADLDKWRKDRVADVNKYNNARGVLNKKLIDEILFSPHKIESACEEKGFFKVKKKSNRTGDFDANSIPTNGWSEK
jgi:hypothetical protein